MGDDREQLLAADDELSEQIDDTFSNHRRKVYRLYPRRWYILTLFAVIGIAQNLVYGTFGAIGQSVGPALGLNQTDLALIPNWYNIAYFISIVPFIWLVERKGLRFPTAATAAFVAAGAAIRCLHTGNLDFDKVFIHLGQILNGFAAPIPWFACTHISAVWFPPSERTLATSIGLFASGLGISFSFLIGPSFVQLFSATHSVHDAIYMLLYFECIICTLLLGLTIAYFPSKPPTPPCYTATVQRTHFTAGFLDFARNRNAWIMLVAYSISSAVFSSWTQFLTLTVKGVMDDVEAGWVGFTMTTAAVCAGPILVAGCGRPIKRHPKAISAVLFILGLCTLTVFLLATELFRTQLLTRATIWLTLVPAQIFITGAQPVWWELTCDAVYPVPETVVSGIFSLGSCFVSAIFFGAYSIPSLGTHWVNWVLLLGEAICLPLLLMYRHIPKRSLDDSSSSGNTNRINVNSPP